MCLQRQRDHDSFQYGHGCEYAHVKVLVLIQPTLLTFHFVFPKAVQFQSSSQPEQQRQFQV